MAKTPRYVLRIGTGQYLCGFLDGYFILGPLGRALTWRELDEALIGRMGVWIEYGVRFDIVDARSRHAKVVGE